MAADTVKVKSKNTDERTQSRSKERKFPFEIDSYLELLIQDRKQTFFDGKVLSLTSTNDAGEFDVLPQHANFITMIKEFVKIYETEEKTKTFDIKEGVMRVQNGKVEIYLTV